MNIQEYISSGILESFALGEVTESERQDVEKALRQYPEVLAELKKVEATLEAFAFKAAVAPRLELRGEILSRIASHEQTKTVSLTGYVVSAWRYAAAVAIVVAAMTSYLAYDYRSRWIEKETAFNELNARNRQIAEEYNVVNQKLDKIQGDLSIMESTAFTKVVMKGTANAPQALASVYWNTSTREVYVSIQNLREISRDHQFQLWAIVDGKPVDAGVFDSGFNGLLKMKSISGASAFAVTIEPRGGKVSPTLSTMQVVGALPAEKNG